MIARFDLDPREADFVRSLLTCQPDPNPAAEAEMAARLIIFMDESLQASALSYVRSLAGQSRAGLQAQEAPAPQVPADPNSNL